MILYTSIAKGKPAETYAEQWAAFGDKDLVRWQKHPGNPVLTEALHGDRKVFDWRDPFLFRHEGVAYLVIGGNLNQRQGGQAVVNLYRAEDDQLSRWKYVGVLFTHPDPTVGNIECPNFFKLDNRWVLVVSPHRAVEYFIGDFDAKAGRFTPRTRGILDPGNLYAPSSCLDAHGRRIMWGWVNGFKSGRGWNGCLTIPRVLSLKSGSVLLQKPATELKRLRGDHFRISDVPIEETLHEITGARGDCLEIYAQIELMKATSAQLRVRRSADGVRSIPITVTRSGLDVAGTQASLSDSSNARILTLRVFLDKSVLEVFANDCACITRVIDCPPGDGGIAIMASGGVARLRSLHAWTMRP